MDSPALGIGVACGIAVGALLVWFWMRVRLADADELAAELAEARDKARKRLASLSTKVADSLDDTLSTVGALLADIKKSLEERATGDERFVDDLMALVSRPGDDFASDGDGLAEAEQATEELAGSERRLGSVIDDVERRSQLVHSVLETAEAEERMTEHKVDDLMSAAAEAVGSASIMDESIRKLQTSASDTAELSTQVSTEADRGYRAVHRTLDEIERIRTLTNAARERIESLDARVSDIGHVVKVIGEITEKTNLLALNASIIAAQAGEHGRSFAVVANEIKALAQRTAASTKEISEQIRGVQEESERATSAMIDGVAAVTEGFQVAISAGDALDAIRQSARSAQKRVQSMTRTLRQQSTVAQQVVDTTASVSDRSSSFASAIRTQASVVDRVRGAALDIQEGASQISDLLREHGASSTQCMVMISNVVEQLTLLRKRDRDVHRVIEQLQLGIGHNQSHGRQMQQQWREIQRATDRIRETVESLRRG